MNKKRNGGYGCGSIIAILVIFVFLLYVLPIAITIVVMAVIIFWIYKNITKKKNKKNDAELSQGENINEDGLEINTLVEDDSSDIVYRKNKLISEQNFEIAEKNDIINKLNRKIKENKDKYEKLLSEREVLIAEQKSSASNREETIQRLKNELEEIKRKNNEETNSKYIKMSDLDPYTWDAALSISQREKCNESMIQRQFRVGFNRVCRIIDELYMIGIVGENQDGKGRDVLVDKYGMPEIYKRLNEGLVERRDICKECTKKDFIIYELKTQMSKLKESLRESNFSQKELERTVENLNKEIESVDGEYSKRQLILEEEFQEKYFEYEERKKRYSEGNKKCKN